MNRNSEFDLARRLRREGAPLGELFSFIGRLYFRGKPDPASYRTAPRLAANALFVASEHEFLRKRRATDHFNWQNVTLRERRSRIGRNILHIRADFYGRLGSGSAI
jgi:hypothetical protein